VESNCSACRGPRCWRIRAAPLVPEDATTNIDEILRLPHARVLAEEDGFWHAYRKATRGLAPRGNFVPDCHIAALLLQRGLRVIYTNDADFRRFAFLDVRNPLED
jgi:predicted nucleic acid-binding protein